MTALGQTITTWEIGYDGGVAMTGRAHPHCGFWNFKTNSSTGVGLRNTMPVRASSGWRRKLP